MSDYIPEEVLVQILLRVPAKPLSEFKCVCKLWYSLINNPYFISQYTQFAIKSSANKSQLILRHYDRLNRQEIFTLQHDDGNSFNQINKEFDLPFENRPGAYKIIGTYCGLVCLIEYSHDGLSKSAIIWNPSLESSVRIMFKFTTVNLETIHGFGFDPMTDDYKVVRIICRKRYIEGIRCPTRQVVQVYALKVGSWKTVRSKAATSCRVIVNSPQAYVNGALHWVGYKEENLDHNVYEGIKRRLVLFAFDMSEEVLKELNMPDEVKTDELTYEINQKLLLGELGQKLSLMHYYTQWHNSPSYDGCCIWMMNEYGVVGSWTKQFKIDLRLGLGRILGLRTNGEILLVTRYNQELVSFDTVNRKIQSLGIYGDTWSFYLDTYMESLVLMQRINGVSAMPMPGASATSSSERVHCGGTSGVAITNRGFSSINEEKRRKHR